MALWQFLSLSVPIGALLLYVGVLSARIGSANTRLEKIAEALQSLKRGPVQADIGSAEVARPAASQRSNGHGGYLTIRDLRAKQTLPTSSSTIAPSPSTPAPSALTPAQHASPVQEAHERLVARKASAALRRGPVARSIGEGYIPPYLRTRVASELARGPSPAAETSAANETTLASNARARDRVHLLAQSRNVSNGSQAYATNSDAATTPSDNRCDANVNNKLAYQSKTPALQIEAAATTSNDNGFGELIVATTEAHDITEMPAAISESDVSRETNGVTVKANAPALEEAATLTLPLPGADTDAHVARSSLDPVELILEPSSSAGFRLASDEAPSASCEGLESPELVAGANGSSANRSSEAEALAKKKRDALLFLNNQRRRRRLHRAY